jgi:hypothetical protein
VVIGGLGALTVAGLWSTVFPELRNVDELTAESLRKRIPQGKEILSDL